MVMRDLKTTLHIAEVEDLQATKHLSPAETLVIRLRVRADLDASR
jgi:hypothetical protein